MPSKNIAPAIFNLIETYIMANRKELFAATIVLAIAVFTSCIAIFMPAYAGNIILTSCGPTQAPNLSIAIRISGFSPYTFLHYKYIRPDNLIAYGGFSAGASGENNVAINVGPQIGTYRFYVYGDNTDFSDNLTQHAYASNILLPCKDRHFTTDFYKNHSQILKYLLGIQPIYQQIKIGNYLVGSPRNALNILNSSHSVSPEDQLAAQTLTAELNSIGGGAYNCIAGVIGSANDLLRIQNYYGPTKNYKDTTVDSQSRLLFLKNKLEAYNLKGCE